MLFFTSLFLYACDQASLINSVCIHTVYSFTIVSIVIIADSFINLIRSRFNVMLDHEMAAH